MRRRQSSSAPSSLAPSPAAPPRPPQTDFVRLFRLPSAALLCLVAALVLVGVRQHRAALGVGIGLALFVLNALLLYLSARSLLGSLSRGGKVALAGVSSLGRMGLLAVAVGLVALWDRAAGLGGCGGLLLCQGNLRVGYIGGKGKAPWRST